MKIIPWNSNKERIVPVLNQADDSNDEELFKATGGFLPL